MNKEEFLAMFKECVEDGSISIGISVDSETDYGKIYKSLTFTLSVNGEKIIDQSETISVD